MPRICKLRVTIGSQGPLVIYTACHSPFSFFAVGELLSRVGFHTIKLERTARACGMKRSEQGKSALLFLAIDAGAKSGTVALMAGSGLQGNQLSAEE